MLSFINFLKSGCFVSLTLLFGLVMYLQHNIDIMEKEIIALENNITMQQEQYSADIVESKIDDAYNNFSIPDTFIEFEDEKEKHEKDTKSADGIYGTITF